MAHDLRSFLDQLKAARPQDYAEITREVDPAYEAIALLEMLEKENRSPALVFHNLKGHDMPMVLNLTSSYDRLAMAIGTDQEHMVEHFAKLAGEAKPLRWVDRADAPVKQVVRTEEAVDLYELPFPVHNELDAGQYLSSGVALVRDPDTGEVNGGVYRHQVQGKDQLGWFVNPSNHGNYVRIRYEELKQPMDVAIVIGHHPALLLAAASKIGGIGGELFIMGGLLQESVDVVQGETVDLPIPAHAEIVIEGKVFPGERHDEGPFGEWPRYYTGAGEKPYMKVTAITMRRDAMFQDVAPAMAEHHILGALPRMGSLYQRIKEVVPSVQNVSLPLSGGGRTFCYVSIKKSVNGEANRVGFVALATDPNIREVVVVDDDIDVFDEKQVLWARATRFQADKDLAIIPNTVGAFLIPTSYDYKRTEKGPMETKMIFDATMPLPSDAFPKRTRANPEAVERMRIEDYLGS